MFQSKFWHNNLRIIGERMLFKASVLDNSMSSGLKEAFWNGLFDYFGKIPQTTVFFHICIDWRH
jgi:hypothetical protein